MIISRQALTGPLFPAPWVEGFLRPLLFRGMDSLLGNVPHSASQTFLVFGEQLYLFLTGDSSLPAVFLTTWLIPEAFQAFASFLTASSLPLVKSESGYWRFKISSSLLRLSQMLCWSPLNFTPNLFLAPLVPFTFCVRFQESLRPANPYNLGGFCTIFSHFLAHYAFYEFWQILYDFRQYFIAQMDQQNTI